MTGVVPTGKGAGDLSKKEDWNFVAYMKPN